MKNQKYKIILHWFICTLISFICIYLLVFFGGWKLIESRDPILIELAVSVIVGIIVWFIYELSRSYESKIKELEKRIEKLEKREESSLEQPLIILPINNIQEIDEAGILYLNSEGVSANINYYEAYKGWCKNKHIKRTKPKYICDRTKSDGWKLTFYTNPKIIFHADPNQEELWINIINNIILRGYATFDSN